MSGELNLNANELRPCGYRSPTGIKNSAISLRLISPPNEEMMSLQIPRSKQRIMVRQSTPMDTGKTS